MSGIYIKDMEMPVACYECCMYEADIYYCVAAERDIDIPSSDEGRCSFCPLVPVPDHGRLIDADAFAAEMKKRQDACAEWRDDIKNGGGYGTELYHRAESFWGAMCETKLTLDKMPTIIPAEEGE